MPNWNLWHGCQKISEGCRNCYVYRADTRNGKTDSFIVRKNDDFDLPLRRRRNGEYKIASGELVYTCMTSDFFVGDADMWRNEAWKIIRERSDVTFFIITKRIHRAAQCLPDDWGEGYDNVILCCTAENQRMADFRLPIFRRLPAKHKEITCEPLLERIDLTPHLDFVTRVTAGGESGNEARICDYDWILSIREQCAAAGVKFWFKQTGARFVKNGKLYCIPRAMQHPQAAKANINIY